MPDWRQRGRTLPPIPEDGITTTTEAQRTAARRTVAQQAVRLGLDATAAAEIMLQLGIFPNQDVEDFKIPDNLRTPWS